MQLSSWKCVSKLVLCKFCKYIYIMCYTEVMKHTSIIVILL